MTFPPRWEREIELRMTKCAHGERRPQALWRPGVRAQKPRGLARGPVSNHRTLLAGFSLVPMKWLFL